MKVKLSHEQAKQLFDFITEMLTEFPYENRTEKILDVLVRKFRYKLLLKLNAIKKNNGYSITLSEEEALGFEEWLSQISSSIPDLNYIYEKNLATKISHEINYRYG